MTRTLLLAASLAACTTEPTGDPYSPGDGFSCTIDPTTSQPAVLFDGSPVGVYGPSINAWVGVPVRVQVGWNAEGNTCGPFGSPAVVAPTIRAAVTTTGAAAQTVMTGSTDTNPDNGETGGAYALYDVTPTAPGAITIEAATDNVDDSDHYVETYNALAHVLDDIQIACVLGSFPNQTTQPCGETIAPGTAFTITIVGLSGGESFIITPQLAWVGTDPQNCPYGACSFPQGADQSLTVTAVFAGVTRSLTVTVQ